MIFRDDDDDGSEPTGREFPIEHEKGNHIYIICYSVFVVIMFSWTFGRILHTDLKRSQGGREGASKIRSRITIYLYYCSYIFYKLMKLISVICAAYVEGNPTNEEKESTQWEPWHFNPDKNEYPDWLEGFQAILSVFADVFGTVLPTACVIVILTISLCVFMGLNTSLGKIKLISWIVSGLLIVGIIINNIFCPFIDKCITDQADLETCKSCNATTQIISTVVDCIVYAISFIIIVVFCVKTTSRRQYQQLSTFSNPHMLYYQQRQSELVLTVYIIVMRFIPMLLLAVWNLAFEFSEELRKANDEHWYILLVFYIIQILYDMCNVFLFVKPKCMKR